MPRAPAEAERNIKNAVESRSWAGSKRCKVYRESGKIHHKGAICLSIELKSDLILLDESEARRIVDIYNLKKTGVLGVLLKAKKENLIYLYKVKYRN